MPKRVEYRAYTKLTVTVVDDEGYDIGEFTVYGEASGWSDKESVQDLTEQAVLRAGKRARALAAGVDNNEKARLK
jgi:hypothetical protein